MLEEVARLKTSGNGNISDNVRLAVARYSFGATGGGAKRLKLFEAIDMPTVRNGSISRATMLRHTDARTKASSHFGSPLQPTHILT